MDPPVKPLPTIALVATLAAIHPVRADVLEPVEGGRLRLPASVDGDRVLLETPDGPFAFPRGDFRKITSEPWPARDWPSKKAAAMLHGAPERLAAALWALDRGLIPEAELMLRAAHEADPLHEPTARLVKVVDRLNTPLPDPDLPPLLLHLPRPMLTARGPHVLLFHQHSLAEAAERIDVLERVIKAYYLTFAALGFDLPAPTHRLPSAWLARKSDYLAYLHAESAEAFLNTRGFHHPTRGLVVAYDCRSDPGRVAARVAIEARRGQRETASTEGLDRQLDREEIRMDLDRREIDLAVAAHETAHQLVKASRLAPGPEAFPHWLSEGLAMQFEAMEAGRWAGLGPPSSLRLADYARISQSTRLIPILRDAGFGQGYRQDAYAKAWALTYYLRIENPQALVAYLDALRVPRPPENDANRHEQAFLGAIDGHPAEFQSRWQNYMRLLGPTQESDPK